MSAAQSHIRAHRVSRRQPCPVCQKNHGCLLYEHQVVCLRVSSDQPATGGLGGWVHSLHEPSLFQAALHTFTQPSQRLAPPTTLDRIYRALHDELVLTSAHLRHLTQERQLSPEAIQARAYRSWGQGERLLRSRLAQTLYERFGGQVLDVPGFLLREQRRSYLSLGGPPGILLPVRDVDGRVIAHQIRTDDPRKSGKYVWLSSSSRGGPGPGSPMHVSRALLPTSSWRVWLTEGILKADICSGLLQETVLALPGVQADKYFLDTLLALKERNQISELVIALDSDWHTKEPVAQARLKLAELAARHGIPVWLADWTPELKGLDDLLLAGGVPKLTPYQVSGNGKRPFEPVTAPPRPQQKALSLVQARRFIKSQLSQALQGDLGNPQELGILLSSLPGSGKSQILTEVLNDFHRSRNSRRYSAYFVPRHDLAATQGRASWAFLSGRTRLDSATGHTPCAYPQRQLELSRLQIPGQVGCDHCPLLQACKENQTPVPARHGQGHHPYYWGQFQQKSKVRVYPAQHFLTPSLWRHPAAVILDDCDLKSLMLEDFFLTQSQLGYALHWSQQHVDHTYAKAQPLLFLLYEILRQAPAGQPFTWQGPELLEELERQAQAHKLRLEDILDDAQQAEEPDPFHQRNLVDGPSAVPVRFLTRLLGVLHYEWQQLQQQKPYNRRLRLERSGPGQEAGLRLTLRRDLPIQALSHSLLILSDASTSLDEAQRLFPERRWIELKPTVKIPAAAQIIQFPEKNYGKVHLSKPEERQKALALLEELIQRQPDPTKVGLITHQSFASLARQRFPEIKIGHYYGQRGSNEFTTCEVLIIFGTPNPNPQDLERQAEALYWDEEVVNRQTLLEARTFCQSGESTLQTRVRSYADPRLREMLQGKRDEELLQAIFRARPLSLERETEQLTLDFDTPGSKRESVTVYVFSSVPLQGLEVALEASPATPPSAEPKVVDLHEAAQRIWRQNQQLTDQRLATAARTQRSAVLRWKRNRPRYEVEAAPPPSQGPPACNLFDDVPPELIASLL